MSCDRKTPEQMAAINKNLADGDVYVPVTVRQVDASPGAWKVIVQATGELVYVAKSQSELTKLPEGADPHGWRELWIKRWLAERLV